MGLLGARLRELRGSLSLYEVSKATGISSADIGKYETEDYHPKPATLKKLAEYFEVDYRELRMLHYEDEFSDPEERAIVIDWACHVNNNHNNHFNPLEHKLIEAFRKQPTDRQLTLLEHIQGLLETKIQEAGTLE